MLVFPVLAAFATSLMVARVGLIIADFPEFSENTLAGKSGESSYLPGGGFAYRRLRSDAFTPTLSHGRGRKH